MDNELLNIGVQNIKDLIYTIRGKQVILDSDVAILYHYETKKINETVKRNIRRFPEKFCFRLTKEEYEEILLKKPNNWSQIATSSTYKNRGISYLPNAFTEQGIGMLSGLLKNEIAIQVSINIMDAFVEMRKFINANKNLFERIINIENTIDKNFTSIDKQFMNYDNKFEQIFNALQKEESFKQKIFFEGQIYDAYSLIIDIIKKAKTKITIIDNYIDDSILKMLVKKNKSVEVVILTSEKSKISKLDIQKFNKEYPALKVAKTDKFHDRFIIVDNVELYHCGASIKDLGKKCFGISKMENEEVLNIIKSIV